MCISLDHGLGFPAAQALKFVRRRSGLPMPSGKGMPQIMPPKIMDFSPQQRIAPSLGVDLDNRIAFISGSSDRPGAVPALPWQLD